MAKVPLIRPDPVDAYLASLPMGPPATEEENIALAAALVDAWAGRCIPEEVVWRRIMADRRRVRRRARRAARARRRAELRAQQA